MWRSLVGRNFKEFNFRSQAVGGKINETSPLVHYYRKNVSKDFQPLNPQFFIPLEIVAPTEGFKEHIEIRYNKSATTHRVFTEGLSDFQIDAEIKKHIQAANELLQKFPIKKTPLPDHFYYFDRTKPVPPSMFPLDDRIANPE